MRRERTHFLFLNVGHFLDHLFVLIFATVAALRLTEDWGMSYGALIPYATPGLVAFGLCSIPAGWLADRWSRQGMMAIFFVGIGASSLLAALAETPVEIALTLTVLGVFAAIYHPVGLAMVVQGRDRTGVPIAINGIFGNMGVATAALLTGFLIDTAGWRAAFVIPGLISIALGVLYVVFVRSGRTGAPEAPAASAAAPPTAVSSTAAPVDRGYLRRVFGVIFFTTAVGGLIFQSTTFSLPKVFDERLTDLAGTATAVGGYAFAVFAVAAFAQLVVGYLVDNHSVRTVFAFVALLQAIFLGAMVSLTGVPALVVAIGFMLLVFGQIPINDVLVGRATRSEWRARAYAARYIVTFSVSASAVPLIAWIHGSYGFGLLFATLSLAALCMLAAVLLLPRTGVVLGQQAATA